MNMNHENNRMDFIMVIDVCVTFLWWILTDAIIQQLFHLMNSNSPYSLKYFLTTTQLFTHVYQLTIGDNLQIDWNKMIIEINQRTYDSTRRIEVWISFFFKKHFLVNVFYDIFPEIKWFSSSFSQKIIHKV